MGNLYGHKITALAGVVNFLEKRFPESEAYKGIKTEKVCKKYITVNYASVNELMKDFRKEKNGQFSKNIDKNAEYIQKNWGEFVEYLKKINQK